MASISYPILRLYNRIVDRIRVDQLLSFSCLVVAGIHEELDLVEVIELADHPFFVATQYHPEFRSKPTRAHPLFREFITAACKRMGAG